MLSLPKLSIAQSTMRLADLKSRDALEVGDRFAAGGADFLDHVLGRRARLPGTVEVSAEIVHDDLGAVFGQQQRLFAPDAAAGTCYDRDLPIK